LQERYGQRTAVDMSDAWSEEDWHDLAQASLAHAERTIWTGEEECGRQPARCATLRTEKLLDEEA